MKNKKLKCYINNYLGHIKITCKSSTYSQYEYVINSRILPKFGNVKINKIDEKNINNYTDYLMSIGLNSKTIKDTLIILDSILKYNGIKLNIAKPRTFKKEITILTRNDQKKLEEYLKTNIDSINISILLALFTGIRIGELCALTWDNINLEDKYIIIDKTLTRIKEDNKLLNKTKIIIDRPKTNSSIRKIPIPNILIEYLKQIKKEDNSYLLTGSNKYMEPRTLSNKFRKIQDRIGLNNYYNFHTLRHTFATRCIEIGSDYKTLSDILGHSSVKTTLEIYVHTGYEDKIKVINNLVNIF